MAAVKINSADGDIIANELEVRNQILSFPVTVCVLSLLACILSQYFYLYAAGQERTLCEHKGDTVAAIPYLIC